MTDTPTPADDLATIVAAMESTWPDYIPDPLMVDRLSRLVDTDADAAVAAVHALTETQRRPPSWPMIQERTHLIVRQRENLAMAEKRRHETRDRMRTPTHPEVSAWWADRVSERRRAPHRYPPHLGHLPSVPSAPLPILSCPGCAADAKARDAVFADRFGPLVPPEMFPDQDRRDLQ